MTAFDDFSRTELLYEAAYSDTITVEETAELEELLASDPAARQAYEDFIQMNVELHFRARAEKAFFGPGSWKSTRDTAGADTSSDEQFADDASVESPLGHAAPRSKSLLKWASRHPKGPAIAIAATILIAALVVMGLVPVKEWIADGDKAKPEEREPEEKQDFVARLSNWKSDVWLEDTRPPLDDPRLEIGRRLKIESGLIEVTYLSGARVVIEGPAEFTVGNQESVVSGRESEDSSRGRKPADATNSGFLKLGKLVARVEGKKAQGFTIDTPSARVEDLGTEFGVEVQESGATEFVVLSGKVNIVRETSPGVVAERVPLAAEQGAYVAAITRRIEVRDRVDTERLAALRRQIRSEFVSTVDFTDDTALLRVDFQATPESRVQQGFVSYSRAESATGKTIETASGTLNVFVTGFGDDVHKGFFDRGVLTNSRHFQAADLYNDYVHNNSGGTVTLTISGIEANHDYDIRLYSSDRYDHKGPQTHVTLFRPAGETTGLPGRVTFDRTTAPRTTLQHSSSIRVRSTTDTLTIEVSPESGGLTRFNGFELFSAQADIEQDD